MLYTTPRRQHFQRARNVRPRPGGRGRTRPPRSQTPLCRAHRAPSQGPIIIAAPSVVAPPGAHRRASSSPQASSSQLELARRNEDAVAVGVDPVARAHRHAGERHGHVAQAGVALARLLRGGGWWWWWCSLGGGGVHGRRWWWCGGEGCGVVCLIRCAVRGLSFKTSQHRLPSAGFADAISSPATHYITKQTRIHTTPHSPHTGSKKKRKPAPAGASRAP